jgi:hypothetical protein
LFYRPQKRVDFLIAAYKAILCLIPKLNKILPIQGDADAEEYFFKVANAVRSAHIPHHLLTYIMQIQGGCSLARSESIRRVKQNMVVYLGAGRKPVKIDTQIMDKSLRGLNHPQIGHLLIPAEHLLKWDEDPDV